MAGLGIEIDQSMLELFRIELENHAKKLETGLVEIEQDHSAKKIEPLMRAAHSIKGAARIIGLDIAVVLAHAMEDVLTAAQSGNHTLLSDDIDILLAGNDIFSSLSALSPNEIATSIVADKEKIEELSKQIKSILSKPLTPVSKNEIELSPPQKKAVSSFENAIIPNENIAASVSKKSVPPMPTIDSSMLELFQTELQIHSKNLENGINSFNLDSSSNYEALARAAHSIKGAVKIIGLDVGVALSQAMEDMLLAAQAKKFQLTQTDLNLLQSANSIYKTASNLHKDDIPSFFYDKLSELDNVERNIRLSLSGELTQKVSKPNIEEQVQNEKVYEKSEALVHKQIPRKEPITENRAIEKARDQVEIVQKPIDNNSKPIKLSSVSKQEDSFVRVLSSNLNRLMGFAGEGLVQSRSVQSFSASLLRLKNEISEINSLKENVFNKLDPSIIPESVHKDFRDSTIKLNKTHDMLIKHIEEFEQFSRRLENIAERLYTEAIATRMKPFSEAVYGTQRSEGFPRMVRDLAKTLDKKVFLEIKGEKTRVDRDILEKLESPLTHLVRNAIDHGIETPDIRVAAGKNPTGRLTIEARHSSGMLIISISDDGRGIDPESLRNKIVEKGYTSMQMAEKMKISELMEFLFLPGFSTAKQVTEISGRGVGLDVVFSMVHEVGGTIRAESEPGLGSIFILQLPLTLSVMPSLLVEINGEIYGFPLSRIERILKINKESIKLLEDRQYCTFEGEHIGIVDALQVFGLNKTTKDANQYPLIVLADRFRQTSKGTGKYGLVVGKFLGEKNLVVIPLDPKLGRINSIAAGAILEDGTPVLIVDVDDMVRNIDKILSKEKVDKIGGDQELITTRKKRVLIVDDSLTVREVERKLLENKGYEVETAVDGMDGWNTLNRSKFDLIISDVDMPRMNGIDFVARIKNNQNYKNLPVMIVSYKDREEDKMRGLDAGANYYLTKSSFHDDSMIEAVKDLIGEA